MGFINLKDLLTQWGNKKVSSEQVHGQVLQWAIKADELLVALNVRTKNTNSRLDIIEKKLNIKK